MPRTLAFNDSHLDARILRRGVVARLSSHPEVFSVERMINDHPAREGHIFYRITLRSEADSDYLDTTEPTDPALARLFREFEFHEPERGLRSTPFSQLLEFDAALREQIIQQALGTAEGRSRLAQSMIAPLRARLDYQGIARRTFLVEELPQGALPTYDRDPEVARLVGWDGNGSPMAEPPPWVQPGVWAYNRFRDEYAEILQKQCPHPGVQAQIWRSPEPPRWFDVDHFYENWSPCERPSDPRPVWDRLLGDDTL